MAISYNEIMTGHVNERTVLYVNDEGEVAPVHILSAPLRSASDEQDTVFVLNRVDDKPRILRKPLREICKTKEEVLHIQASYNTAINKALRKMKDEERKAFTGLFTHTISWFCHVALVVFVILKLTGNID